MNISKYSVQSICVFLLLIFNRTHLSAQFNYIFVADTLISLDQNCQAIFALSSNPYIYVLSTVPPPTTTTTSYEMDTLLTGYNFGDTLYGESVINMAIIAMNTIGNIDTTYYNIHVEDLIPPTILGFPPDTTISCLDTLPVPTIGVDIVGVDNCDPIPIITYLGESTIQVICNGSKNNIRQWSVKDNKNNAQIYTQSISIIDTIPPVFVNVPNDTTLECSQIPPPPLLGLDGFQLYDECGSISVFNFSESISGTGCLLDTYIVTRQWTAIDDCGNTTIAEQNITLIDSIAPTFTVPLDVVIACQFYSVDTIVGVPTNILDNCDPNPVVSHSDVIVPNGCANDLLITRTWTVTDACGNAHSVDQHINISDTEAPEFYIAPLDTIVQCADSTSLQMMFNLWVLNHAQAVANDNCDVPNNLNWFAFNNGTIDPPSLNLSGCSASNSGIFTSQKVDFFIIDRCLNQSLTLSATFSVQDTMAPILVCPPDTILETALGSCQNVFVVDPPLFYESCGAIDTFISVDEHNGPVPIFSDMPGDPNSLVNTFQIDFLVPNSSDVFISNDPTIQILISNLDGNDPLEYFNVLDEDNQLIGQTNFSLSPCGSSLTTILLNALSFNEWALDGVVSFTLVPNMPSLGNLPDSLGINDICNTTNAIAHINYMGEKSGTIANYQYNINSAPWVTIDPITSDNVVLNVGVNTVNYQLVDCAGNVGSCSSTVTVIDTEPPIINCPVLPIYSVNMSCDTNIIINLPPSFSDNCSFNNGFQQSGSIQQISFASWGTFGYIAEDMSNTFINCPGPAIGDAILTVYIHGDINSTGEFFEVFAEGQLLNQGLHPLNPLNGTTSLGVGCNQMGFETYTFYVPAETINNWLEVDGAIDVNALANRDTLNYSQFVSPCTSFTPGTPDGTIGSIGDNEIYFELNYPYATVEYYIADAQSDSIIIPMTTFAVPQLGENISLSVGDYDLYYIIEDAYGLADTCATNLLIKDTQIPLAVCDTFVVYVNPSGADSDFLMASSLNLNSTDNCSIDSLIIDPITFDCDNIGLDTIINLIVLDPSGNIDSCGALVKVRMESFQPSYQLGLCLNDTVRFFANPPLGVFSYEWRSPQNVLFSVNENPELIDLDNADSGTYTVTITGPTGCSAVGSVFINIMSTANTPMLSIQNDTICQDEMVNLVTTSISGANVSYNWHQIDPNDIHTVISTDSAFLSYSLNMPGTYEYYLRVQLDGCNSASSIHLFVEVLPKPTALVNASLLLLCEGDSLGLGTSSQTNNLMYEWTNPDGIIFSTLQDPPPFILNSTLESGAYELVTILNGCRSLPSTTEVIVSVIPPTPTILSPAIVCEGDTLTLRTNVPNADVYYWVNSQNDTILSVDNTLFLNSVDSNDEGWYVFIKLNNCFSQNSMLFENFLVPSPLAITNVAGSICEGDTLSLIAGFEPMTTFLWTTPMLDSVIGDTANILAQEGMYCLDATNSFGCVTQNCTNVTLLNTPQVTSISQDGVSCVNGTSDIHLMPTVFPINVGSYNYEWSGPLFTSITEIATIINAEESNNGLYNLVVKDGICVSDTVGINLDINDIPTVMGDIILDNVDTSFCIGDTLRLSVAPSLIADAQYIWTGPGFLDTTSMPQFSLSDLELINAGDYSVVIDNKGCLSAASPSVIITVFDYPEIPNISADSPVCEHTPLSLSLNTIYSNAHFFWTGPGFNSVVPEPVIVDALMSNTGNYNLAVEINGCTSISEMPLEIVVSPALQQPVISSNSPLCLDDFNGLELVVSASTFAYDALYTWTNQDGDTLGVLQDDTLNIIDPNLLQGGIYTISVNGFRENCTEDASALTVVVDTIPDEVVSLCVDQISLCPDDTLVLCANQNMLGQGQWFQVFNSNEPFMNIDDNLLAQTFVENLPSGYDFSFAYTLANAGCGIYSQDTLSVVSLGLITPAQAGEDIVLCDAPLVTLGAAMPMGNIDASWTQSSEQSQEGVIIDMPSSPMTSISGLSNDITYAFVWEIENLDCPEFFTDTVLVTNYAMPSIVSFAGDDIIACADVAELNATMPSLGEGTWISLGDNIVFSDVHDPTASIANLEPGVNKFLWVLSNGACQDYSSDIVNVFYLESSIAVDDSYIITEGGDLDFNVLDNDALSGDFTLTFTAPNHGQLSTSTPGHFIYLPQSTYSGIDTFTYIVCSEECLDQCSEAKVTLSIEASTDCTVPTIFTPNNDAINDYFVIPCLASGQYEDSELTILNQWGDIVFYASPYNNDWDGTKEGLELPISTYFYVIKFSKDQVAENGFLMLER